MDHVMLSHIINELKPLHFLGNEHALIQKVRSIDHPLFDKNAIGWCSDKNAALLLAIQEGTVIISENLFSSITPLTSVNYIVVAQPRLYFSEVITHFFAEKPTFGYISSSAQINENVIFNPKEVHIGNNVVIENGVTLGKNVTIQHNTVIKAHTLIGNHVTIGCNCTIGGVGFGYEKNEDGQYTLIPHIGNVVLEDHVEIGNNVCIDRAVLESTLLRKNVKVDNLVHIAHGVEIGANSLIIANAMIAGSVKIGENTWIAPSSSIIQKTTVGNDVIVGLGSVVLKNVEDGSVVAGVPARKIEKK
jgi:UDP-3-O-[3-hydroxymyristoyl] glucosamine N-acyltransferase